MINKQLFLFIIAGGAAALANFGSRICLGWIMNYIPSIIAAYFIGMATAFFLNRIFVFKDADTALREQAFWFLLVNLIAVLQTIFISLLLANWLFPIIDMKFYPETVAHAIAVIVPVITSYLGHKHLSFRKKR